MTLLKRLLAVTLLAIAPSALAVDQVTLQLKWIPQFQFAGYYVAQEKGFYEDVDIDVEINPGGVDSSTMKLVAAGAADFGVSSPDQIFLARDKGLKVMGLMAVYQYSPTGLMVKESSDIDSPEDFPGHTVGLSFGELTELEYRAILNEANVDASGIKEVKKQYNISPFLKDQVHIWSSYVTNEPYQALREGEAVKLFTGRDFGVEFYGDTLVAPTELIEANPDLVRRFVQASRRGWVYAMRNMDESLDIVSEYADKERDYLRFEAEKTIPLLKSQASMIHGFGWQQPSRYDYTQRKLQEADMVDAQVEDMDSVMTNEFLNP